MEGMRTVNFVRASGVVFRTARTINRVLAVLDLNNIEDDGVRDPDDDMEYFRLQSILVQSNYQGNIIRIPQEMERNVHDFIVRTRNHLLFDYIRVVPDDEEDGEREDYRLDGQVDPIQIPMPNNYNDDDNGQDGEDVGDDELDILDLVKKTAFYTAKVVSKGSEIGLEGYAVYDGLLEISRVYPLVIDIVPKHAGSVMEFISNTLPKDFLKMFCVVFTPNVADVIDASTALGRIIIRPINGEKSVLSYENFRDVFILLTSLGKLYVRNFTVYGWIEKLVRLCGYALSIVKIGNALYEISVVVGHVVTKGVDTISKILT